jgi:hypothetical protein
MTVEGKWHKRQVSAKRFGNACFKIFDQSSVKQDGKSAGQHSGLYNRSSLLQPSLQDKACSQRWEPFTGEIGKGSDVVVTCALARATCQCTRCGTRGRRAGAAGGPPKGTPSGKYSTCTKHIILNFRFIVQ